jgi:hypothetical protein
MENLRYSGGKSGMHAMEYVLVSLSVSSVRLPELSGDVNL